MGACQGSAPEHLRATPSELAQVSLGDPGCRDGLCVRPEHPVRSGAMSAQHLSGAGSTQIRLP